MRVSQPVQDFRIWCQHCFIRIAPHEEKILVKGQAYHQRCHSKLVPAPSSVAKLADRRRGGK